MAAWMCPFAKDALMRGVEQLREEVAQIRAELAAAKTNSSKPPFSDKSIKAQG
jgi:hypothetical protein